MSTIDSYTFISAFTIGKDLSSLFFKKTNEKIIIRNTQYGLIITAIFSIFLAINFEYAIDIWYIIGSFTVPALLIPLISALNNIKINNILIVMITPMLISISWYIISLKIQTKTIFTILDPMYPGILISLVLYAININHHRYKSL